MWGSVSLQKNRAVEVEGGVEGPASAVWVSCGGLGAVFLSRRGLVTRAVASSCFPLLVVGMVAVRVSRFTLSFGFAWLGRRGYNLMPR